MLSIASCIQLSSASIKTATFLSCANWQMAFTLASYSCFSISCSADRGVLLFIFSSKVNLQSPVGLNTEKGMLSEIAAFSIEARVCLKLDQNQNLIPFLLLKNPKLFQFWIPIIYQ